eukprot:TRINITY_DN6174_c0_g1_i2.p1 TRINITY_DN6174_c0_g1~~TRINITY_DN6174_c0_g1_i2.p1  ORF type:complete len:102 (+),score=27.52 TRINITY_DN6174_c0_g1_i2:169-474(+)
MHPSALVSRPHSITDVDVDHAPWNLPLQQAVEDDADGESVEGMLLRMLEEEENNNGFQSFSQELPRNKGRHFKGGQNEGDPPCSWRAEAQRFLERLCDVGC